MRVGIIKVVSCACGWSGELFFSIDDKWRKPCPACKAKLHADGAVRHQRFYGNRRFAGSESVSVTKGFHPREVPFIRKHITAGDIDPATGDVSFTDRADERKFNKQFEAMAEKLGGLPGKNDVGGTVSVEDAG